MNGNSVPSIAVSGTTHSGSEEVDVTRFLELPDTWALNQHDAEEDGVADAIDICPNTENPESTIAEVGRNRWALLDGDTIFDTAGDKGPGFTTADTAGCSCEQIIDELGLGIGHTKHGCSNDVMKLWVKLATE
jgi:hypothetical protein